MRVLVTGGAGFIGSHLVDALVAEGHRARVLDDLGNGLAEQVNSEADLIVGDVTNEELVARAMDGVEVVFHQAALGSVPRSVEAPLATNRANVTGTLAVLQGARSSGVRRVVFASSSSVYGGDAPLPARESHPPAPKSPYAVSKLAGEQYGAVFARHLGVETVALRYFNVYGPRQRADSPYAAVVPRFVDALRRGVPPVIEGDGLQTRDFTYVADAVRANLLAARAPAERCSGKVYNVAGGWAYTVLELLGTCARFLGVEPRPRFTDPRPGDVRASRADLGAALADLSYEPLVGLETGLALTLADHEPAQATVPATTG